MRGWARHVLLCAGMLAFVVSVPLAFAVPPALAGEPCPHESHHMPPNAPHQHHHSQPQDHAHGDAACLCCCVGGCVSMPNLARPQILETPASIAAIEYWVSQPRLAGGSLVPDPAPPRTTA